MPSPRLLLLLCLLGLAARPAVAAPDDAADASAPTGVLTRMPELVRFVQADYPPEAEAERLEGAVVVELDIRADGRVARVQVLESAGHGFDEAALGAVEQFEFRPAEIDHEPAPVRLTYRYEFVLRPAETPPPEDAPGVVTFDGRALERGTRAPLSGAMVVVEREGVVRETASDADGRFAFVDLGPGTWKVSVLAQGFQKYESEEEVTSGEVTSATYYVRRRAGEYEAVVRARRERKEVARRTLTLEEIRKIPGTQGDALRVIQNLPGVARTPLGLGPLVVRGGRPGDTRTYIDGQLVPLLFHFGGLTSVINSDFLETLDMYPGNTPARLGRSIAGAVDVNTRAGKPERVRGYADVSLTEASLFAEGPLGAKGTFMASVRRSYIDAALPLIMQLAGIKGIDLTVAPRYWDYQLKTDFALGRDELSFFLFGSDDRLAFALENPSQLTAEARSDFYAHLGFHRLTARWKRKLTERLEHRLTATLGTDDTTNSAGADLYVNASLKTVTVREELRFALHERLSFSGGLDLIAARFDYGVQGPLPPKPGEFFNPLLNDQLQKVTDGGFAWQPALHLDATWEPLKGLRLVPGVRWDYESYIERQWWDPRFTAFYEVAPKVVLKGSAGLFHQPPSPEKLTRTFGNPNLVEEGSAQYAAGIEWRPFDLIDIDLQVYYKDLFGEATGSTQLTSGEAQAAYAGAQFNNSGQGRAYGVELLLRREPGRGLFGWLAVSLGQSERRTAPGEPWTQSFLNQRYNLVGVLSYKGPWELEFGTRVRLTDGNPATSLGGGIYDSDADVYLPLPGPRRTERNPAFFQVDLRVDRRFVFRKWIFDAYLDVQNVTNRANVEGRSPNYDFTLSRPVTGLPIFPSLGVRGWF